MAERLSRKEKVMGPIPIVALRKLFTKKSRERVRKRKGKEREEKKHKKVVPPRIELGSQEPKSYMLPLHHGTFLKKIRRRKR